LKKGLDNSRNIDISSSTIKELLIHNAFSVKDTAEQYITEITEKAT